MKLATRLAVLAVFAPLCAFAAPDAHKEIPLSSMNTKDMAISAVVGDEVVTSYDVESRMKFVMATTHLSNTPDVIEHVRPQVLRALIDEHLELHEATKNGIKVTDKDIADAIAGIEASRQMPAGQIFKMLDADHVPHDTFINQIHAQLAWNKLVVKKIRPGVHVSDDEIAFAYRQELRHPAPPKVTYTELQIGAILLPVDKPSREKDVKKLADKLAGEIRSGASFEEVARQFSGRGTGGVDKFWIKPQQMEPTLAASLGNAKTGDISDPVRGPDGWQIVKVYGTRGGVEEPTKTEDPGKNIEVQFKEIVLKTKPDVKQQEADALVKLANQIAKHPGNCQDKSVAGIENAADTDIAVNLTRVKVPELPSGVRDIIQGLKPGDVSQPFASSEGVRLYMLCERKQLPPEAADHDRIGNELFIQKIDLEVQKYLRDLRRETYIQVR